MPSFVINEKCDGCKGQDKTACMYICPNDLMILDKERMKAYNQEPSYCWECYCCVKICPQQAMDVRGYADFMPLGAASTPLRGTEDIMWTITFRDGRIKRFKYATRTTPEGSIKALEGFPEAKAADLANQLLLGEPDIMGVKELPTKKK
ncbi:MAG: adenylyl-sulfate reductase subunit beta [Nitrospira sp.]|nr:adenylyl-sulfate reductase subunit beta [Nitrospira sp.]